MTQLNQIFTLLEKKMSMDFSSLEFRDVTFLPMKENDWLDTFLVHSIALKCRATLEKLIFSNCRFSEEYQRKAMINFVSNLLSNCYVLKHVDLGRSFDYGELVHTKQARQDFTRLIMAALSNKMLRLTSLELPYTPAVALRSDLLFNLLKKCRQTLRGLNLAHCNID